MARGWLALALIAGCGRLDFEARVATFVPSHLAAIPDGPRGSLVLFDATIDTTTLTIDGASRGDVTFLPSAQVGGGPELAVLVVDDLTITTGGTVRVLGSRPLLVIATSEIELAGVIDAGGHAGTPGAGGARPAAGDGVGASPPNVPDVCDPGGGGGGFATAGGGGGSESCGGTFGAGGMAYGDPTLAVLVGGSGGGAGSFGDCAAPGDGGAGGGAIQLTAFGVIRIAATGAINAGGGGGAGGIYCGTNDAGAASGGGSGGAIYVEATSLELAGALAADGGGGGAGANGNTANGPVGSGDPGHDATALGSGAGGTTTVTTAGGGGAGGSPTTPPTVGDGAEFNPGGGGGAAGRVVLQPQP